VILDDIVAAKRLDLAMEEKAVPLPQLVRQAGAAPPVRDFHGALCAPGLSVIAEIKRASPSAGLIAGDFDPAAVALQYREGGAAAISVLTERHWFMGCNRHLTQARAAAGLPVLRKDFIISPRQVIGARAIGADAILLIAAILDDQLMRELSSLAQQHGLHCLFEAHTETDVKRAVDAGARIIGINNRDLKTMRVDLNTFVALRRHIPPGIAAVAESGIRTESDALRMREAGADAVLVGESLMRSADAAQALSQLRGL
jgi:indole-3-glycerol phosphate synthase